ncbi:MAG TPA: valine--tRNA ligase, partial [Allosphingosinicella sp.]
TPAHDANDYAVGQRHKLPMIGVLDLDAKVNDNAPAAYRGLDRFVARKKVVADLEAQGLLEETKKHKLMVPRCARTGQVVEPMLTDQWFVAMTKVSPQDPSGKSIAQKAIDAVQSGNVRFVPENWVNTYNQWMNNIQDWCISRQLWWGHQIPAWYDEAGHVYVAETEEEAQAKAGDGVPLCRDPDVLDTWFSSALWPFATLGWPEETATLKRHYPNDVLISGFDIIFFWDARMAMQGFHFMGEKPWKTLYLHGLVRDAKGQKMSKSKGNTVDPLGLIDRFGADALRFTLAAMESQGRDIKLDEKRVEGYRNFATKLWNAARFCQANGILASAALEPPEAALPVNRWIVGETVKTVQALDLALAELRFDESANTIYHFVWATFCDWYLELIKPVSSGDERGAVDEETKAVAGWVLDQILVMLHPFMPFITEELWHAMGERPYPLIHARWPIPDARALDAEAGPEIDWLIRLVSAIRAARAELNVPPGSKLSLHVRDAGEGTQGRLGRNEAALKRLARIEAIGGTEPAGGAAQIVVDEATYVLPLEGVIDVGAERARLEKAAQASERERDALAARLGNASFVERAKPEAVEKAREDHAAKASDAERYRAALARLG